MLKNHLVHITIDRKHYESAADTTGQALYVLSNIQPGYDLFREAHGSGDDELIRNDQNPVVLHDGDKFYSAQSTLNPGGTF